MTYQYTWLILIKDWVTTLILFYIKMQIKILKDFYYPAKKKTLKAGSTVEIEADKDGTPYDSFWFEQLKYKENESYFEKLSPQTKSKK